MNIIEEKLTNWWCKFLVERRDYDILIRSLMIGNNEYDGIGIKFEGAKFHSNVIIENIEAKYSKEGYHERARRELLKQLIRNYDFRIFNSLIGVSNNLSVFDKTMPDYLGWFFMQSQHDTNIPKGTIIRRPGSLNGIL